MLGDGPKDLRAGVQFVTRDAELAEVLVARPLASNERVTLIATYLIDASALIRGNVCPTNSSSSAT